MQEVLRLPSARRTQVATPMSVVQEMITAMIDANGWFGPGVSCAEEAKRFPIAFADFVKKAKVAADIFLVLLLFI